MKKHSLSPEEEADLTLESLTGITRAEVPADLEDRLFSRLQAARTPKWFWAAAVALVFINAFAAWNYMQAGKTPAVETTASSEALFSGGTSWY